MNRSRAPRRSLSPLTFLARVAPLTRVAPIGLLAPIARVAPLGRVAPLTLALAVLPLACVAHASSPAPSRRSANAAALGAAAAPTSPPSSSPQAPPPPARAIDGDFVRRSAVTRAFRAGQPALATPTPDGKQVLFLRSGPRDMRQSLWSLDVATGAERELASPDAAARGPETLSREEAARRERMRVVARGFTSFEISDDGARVLLALSGRLFVLTLGTGALAELATGSGAAIDPHFSPDGQRVAYVRGADLYVVSSDGARGEIAVTKGGTDAHPHGVAEFIAQEELRRARGFWFSPDGARIVYEDADTTPVERLTIADPAHPERPAQVTAYPRAGHANARVRLGIVPAGGGATTWIAWDDARFPYVASVRWDPHGPLLVHVLDRLQENGALYAVDPANGKTRPLVEEHDDAWIELDPSVPRALAGGGFLWASDASGAWQLERRDASGARVATLTDAAFGYRALLDVDEARGVAIVEASAEPTEQGIFEVPLAGGAARAIVPPSGAFVTARFGRGHRVFATREGSASALPRHRVRSVDGASAHELRSVAEDPGFVPAAAFERVGPDAVRAVLLRPRGFDPRRRYPLIDSAYGGPAVNQVSADAFHYVRDQWLADATGAIVVALDARGTPRRGRAWERAVDGRLGDVPLDGHVRALEAIARAHPEIDPARVGIVGWSFGGYLSARAVLARPDVFRAGVAGAPVTDWRDYDTCYTERYLGLPDTRAAAYERASLLPLARAAAGDAGVAPLLVVHGTVDDNVYFAHSVHLLDAMEVAGRPFEFLPLSGVTHMPVDPDRAEALWRRVAEFFRAHL